MWQEVQNPGQDGWAEWGEVEFVRASAVSLDKEGRAACKGTDVAPVGAVKWQPPRATQTPVSDP